MDISLRELLAMPALKGIRIIGGERGLDRRRVSSVTVMDAPDPYQWIQGGELVVTSGYIFRDEPLSILHAVEKLNERESSGFGIKVRRYLQAVPPDAIALADDLEFPLARHPFRLRFPRRNRPGAYLHRQPTGASDQVFRAGALVVLDNGHQGRERRRDLRQSAQVRQMRPRILRHHVRHVLLRRGRRVLPYRPEHGPSPTSSVSSSR